MKPGSVVVWLVEPWTHGVGTVKGVTSQNWLWVEWTDGHFDSYDPLKLQLADEWEREQVASDPAFT